MKVREEEPLARQGYWRVGGPLERFVVVDTVAELRSEYAAGPPALVLGNGSNLLLPDAGLRGTTVRLGGELRAVEPLGGDVWRVGAGVPNAALLQRAARAGLAGVGCLAGVPGTLGGAVAMNAGTTLGEVEARVVAVEGIDGAGAPLRLSRAELPMRYRDGGLPPGFVVTHVHLRLHADADEPARIAAHLARRKATQPLDLPSCGSVFRNPPGDHAGRLIEAVGLRGRRFGDAQISERHANFVVNLGQARALDVMRCIRTAWDTVRAQTGVALVPEVHVMGKWPPELWPLPREG